MHRIVGIKKACLNPIVMARKVKAGVEVNSRPEVKEKIRAIAIANHSNPEFKLKHSMALIKANANPEVKKRRSIAQKKVWSRQDAKEMQSIRSKKLHSLPEIKRRHRAGVILSQSDPEYRINLSKAIKSAQPKVYATKKKNGTFRKSKPEDNIYILLQTVISDLKHHYRDFRYPWVVDYYSPSLDLFIEYNGTWFHGGEPYDSTNPNHIVKLNDWRKKSEEINFQGKTKKSFIHAIHTWTVSDPLKVASAKNNGLNLLVFYNEKQAKEWIQKGER